MSIVSVNTNYMNPEIAKYFDHPLVKQTYDLYTALWEKHSDVPYLNYFGINFDDKGISSVKFYFHVFHEVTKEEVKQFLPTTVDFYKYHHLFEYSKQCTSENSGYAFEIKFKQGQLNPILGFHYKLKSIKESFDLVGHPKLVPFDVMNLGTKPGINYEYSDSGILRKQYYYFKKSEHKAYFAKRFNNRLLNDVNFIEYTESEHFAKINIWVSPEQKAAGLNLFTAKENEIINSLCDAYGARKVGFGYYENSTVRAIYFIRRNSQRPGATNVEIGDHYRDTLQLYWGC